MDIPVLIKVIPSRRISCLSNDDGSKEGKESLLTSLIQQIKCKDDELASKDEQVARLEATVTSLEERVITMSLELASSKAREDVLSLILSKSIQQKQHSDENDTLHKNNNKKYIRDRNALFSSLPNLGSFINSFRRQSDTPLEAKVEDTTSEDTTLLEDSSLVSQNHITTSNTVVERRVSLFSTLQWSMEE